MKRENCKDLHHKWLRQKLLKMRRRIETSFSQLTELFNLNKVSARSLWDLISRLRTKILAQNLCYCINILLGKKVNIGYIKELVFG